MSYDEVQVRLLKAMLYRADKLAAELEGIYTRDLETRDVSDEALVVTHEILEKCSNILDQTMSLVYEYEIKQHLTSPPKRLGYFPVAKDEQSYRSSMGQWGASDLDKIAPKIDAKIRSLQPFTDQRNSILARVRELANQKHTGLTPQKAVENRSVTVTAKDGGSVSWGPGVTFGEGVSVMGVPINPATQMPAHRQGINVQVEVWVRFHFADGGEDALQFCKNALESTRSAVNTLLEKT